MVNYKSRIPVDEAYVNAIGRAVYNFTYLEWGIVGLGELLRPGFRTDAAYLTAGQMGGWFTSLVGALRSADPDQSALVSLAATFSQLVQPRNHIVHAHPISAKGGGQQLRYKGKSILQDWPPDKILEAARDFEAAAIVANDLYHKRQPQQS
jgi:hypothetical protein